MAATFGWECLRLSKFDIQSAYRLIPVHPDDWPHQGCYFEGRTYVDTHLSIGGASAPRLFDIFGQTVQWIVEHELGELIATGRCALVRYVDDILMVSVESSAMEAVMGFKRTMAQLGVPLKQEKEVVMARCLVFLGVQIDLDARTFKIDPAKIPAVTTSLKLALETGVIEQHQARRLVGKLRSWRTVSGRRSTRWGRCTRCYAKERAHANCRDSICARCGGGLRCWPSTRAGQYSQRGMAANTVRNTTRYSRMHPGSDWAHTGRSVRWQCSKRCQTHSGLRAERGYEPQANAESQCQ